jgi:hypothetical protein
MITFSELGNLGRLGNQFFQIAATLSHAKSIGDEAKFPKWSYNELLEHPIDDSLELGLPTGQVRYSEPNFHFDPIPAIGCLDLYGYFQSEKYFAENADLIKHHLQPKLYLCDDINETYHDIMTDITCSIHVRRGDYLQKKDYHPVMNLHYYFSSMQMMVKEFGVDRFVIFSDDIGWCKESIVAGKDYKITYIEGNSDFYDLFAMSIVCDHHIIANSSFSWWGSYLCENKNKQIVAPSDWFGKAAQGNDTTDLYLKNWRVNHIS